MRERPRVCSLADLFAEALVREALKGLRSFGIRFPKPFYGPLPGRKDRREPAAPMHSYEGGRILRYPAEIQWRYGGSRRVSASGNSQGWGRRATDSSRFSDARAL